MRYISTFTLLCICGLFLPDVSAQSTLFKDKTANLPSAYISGRTMDVESGDMDGDGDIDLILAKEVEKNRILWNNGLGEFSSDDQKAFPTAKTYPQGFTGEDSEDVIVFDAENDGDLDLLFVTEDTDLHEFLLNDGKGNFSLAPYQFPHENKSNAVLLLDINEDGFQDVLIGYNGINSLFINDQDGSFSKDESGIWPDNTDWTQDLVLADVNNDGQLDIVEGSDNGQSNLYLYENGKFRERTDLLPATALMNTETRKVLVEDVDMDGDTDIFLCNVGWNPNNDARDLLFINDGTGTFQNESSIRFPYFHLQTLDGVFTDLNGDTYPDLILSGGSETQNFNVYLNNPDRPGFFMPNDDFFPFLVLGTGISMKEVDVNSDGLKDLYFGIFQGSDRLLIQQDISTRIAESEIAKLLKVFPNPVSRQLTVQYPSFQEAAIYSLQGELLKEEIKISPNSKIDVSDLPEGTYLLKLDSQRSLLFEKI